MAEIHPKTQAFTSKHIARETSSNALASGTKKVFPADIKEKIKNTNPTDLFKPIDPQKKPSLGSKLIGNINPLDGKGPWKSSEVEKAVGRVLKSLLESYKEWADDEDSFVKNTMSGVIAEKYVSDNELNVFVFHSNLSGFFFTNAYAYRVDDTAWYGILDKSYLVVVFESCWFKRYGPGGFANWGYTWWGGSWYEYNENDSTMITYKHYPKSAKEIWQEYWNTTTKDGEDLYELQDHLVANSSTGPSHDNTDTIYFFNHYGSSSDEWDWGVYANSVGSYHC
ncbi:hypothetical protein TWF694_002424 [Orbilia ellipsospora]|uniref:Uncharacterized protein n=1 Tax=Orbilia ellipsospora TaxID=2528407 RepID=A0AAV9X328_9PEZI